MIPEFPRFRAVALEDRAEIESYLRRHPPLASEYSFTNLFAWQKKHCYRISRYDGGFLVLKHSPAGDAFLQPLVPDGHVRAVETCLEYLARKNQAPVLERVGEDFAGALGGERFLISPERDQFDYLYRVDDLVALRGPGLHAKANLWNQFVRTHRYQYRELTPDLMAACLDFVHRWCERRGCEEVEGLKWERCAVFRMLRFQAFLGISGAVIELGGEIAALALGEALSPDTFVIHAEKAEESVRGIYQVINREFLANRAQSFTFVNREQDLGVPGLRRAKKSYQPVRLIRKYRVVPRGTG